MASEEYNLKCIVTGPPFVGKSSLLLQFCEKEFTNEMDTTVGVEFQTKSIEIDSTKIKLEIWDTAGQESFRSITTNYYRGSHIALLVYDITMRQSFQHLASWVQEVTTMSSPEIIIILIGNKSDMNEKRVISFEDGDKFAKAHNLLFFETCAKDYETVQKVFETGTRKVLNLIKEGKLTVVNKKPTNVQLTTPPPTPKKKNECCKIN
ncbi:hypothetical protein CYY_003057 [Polysphondylium violaceum]|uniref:Rab GTPase n=1 Tax=Polysphondylium violaceum TaxID=133409 RepID=A0A8J4PZ49_9MYCE|nr:hypothetical protein CYY_003057 [Polysphondylium violaceum]